MLITILEAHVTSERWHLLSDSYRNEIKHLPMALMQTFLIQDMADRNVWRIISEWRSREGYENSSDSKDHDAICMQVFRSVGAEPTRRVFEVHAHHEHV